MGNVKQGRWARKNPLVKTKNPKVLRKLALALAIVLVATVAYIGYLQPHTLEAKQALKLQKTEQQLQQTRQQVEQLKTESEQQDQAKQKTIENLNQQLQDVKQQLSLRKQAAVAYAAEAPDPTTYGWHYDCRSNSQAVQDAVAAQGLSGSWTYIQYIFSHESCLDPGRLNSIGACGLGQALPCSKMNCGAAEIACQVAWFNTYAVNRYGSWYNAYIYWVNHSNW